MTRQTALPGTGRKRTPRKTDGKPKPPAAPTHPSLDELLMVRARCWAVGGERAWQAEKNRRRIDLIARLRERRANGYQDRRAA